MHYDPPPTPTELLDAASCWDLLRGVSVGHLAVFVNGYPEVFPVNYKVDQQSLVFRTGEGTKLRAAAGPLAVALEADGHDDARAWSVLVKGKAVILETSEELLAGAGLTLYPWQDGGKDHFVRIVPTSVSGRRFTITSPLTWWNHVGHGTRQDTA